MVFPPKYVRLEKKFLAGYPPQAVEYCVTQWCSEKIKWKNSPIYSSKWDNMGEITLLPILETTVLNFPMFTYNCTLQVSVPF